MKKRKFRIRYIIAAALIFYVGYTVIGQQIMIGRIKNQINVYKQANAKIENQNSYLRDKIEFAKTNEYKEKVARQKLGLIKPGEIVFAIDDKK
ncbi:MAG: septum formation initiator family protein [Clostridiales bacterium]|nr:septum formation initiator family protein [Clostridiales bacterium]